MQDLCHHCGYDLVGLPTRGSCPECGEVYDKTSIYRAVHANEPAFVKHVKWVTLAAFTLLVLLCGVAVSIRADRPWGALAVTLLIASVSGFGAFAYWWAMKHEQRGSE